MSDAAAAAAPKNILVLCAHNRTRSVMIAGLLRKYLGPEYTVESAGFGPAGLPALPEAAQLLAEQEINVLDHVSVQVTPDMVRWADLILTADKKQVMAVVADLGGDFDKTYTLPEYTSRLMFKMERPRGFNYLASSIGEVEDPTGRLMPVWKSVFASLERQCEQVATSLRGPAGG